MSALISAQFYSAKKINAQINRLVKQAEPAAIAALRETGKYVYRITRNSIKYSADKMKPSKPGTPPRTHIKSGGIKNAVRSELNSAKDGVVIGFSVRNFPYKIIRAHEQGGMMPFKISKSQKEYIARFHVGGVAPIGFLPKGKIRNIPKTRKTLYKKLLWSKLNSVAELERAKKLSRLLAYDFPEFTIDPPKSMKYPQRPTFNGLLDRKRDIIQNVLQRNLSKRGL